MKDYDVLLQKSKELTKAVRGFANNPDMSKQLRDVLYINGIAKNCDVEPYIKMCEINDELEKLINGD